MVVGDFALTMIVIWLIGVAVSVVMITIIVPYSSHLTYVDGTVYCV